VIHYIYGIVDVDWLVWDDVEDLFDVYYLADKYQMSGLKNKVLQRLVELNVNIRNYGELVKALFTYRYFENSCKQVEENVVKFIKIHPRPLELVAVAIGSKNDVVKQEVLNRLVSSISLVENTILETMEGADLILESENCLIERRSIWPLVIESCVRRFEEFKKDPHKFSQFVPDKDSGLERYHSLLLQYMKQNFCSNCDTAVCRKGEKILGFDIRADTLVCVNKVMKGKVVKVGLKVRKKEDYGYNMSELAETHFHCQEVFCICRIKYKFCPICEDQGKSIQASISCSGRHCNAVRISGKMNGAEVTRDLDIASLVFDCKP